MLPWIVVAVVVVAGLIVLRRPLWGLGKLIVRWVGSFFLLFLIQPLGLGLGVNGANALVLGVLGAPGFGLLLLLQWMLG